MKVRLGLNNLRLMLLIFIGAVFINPAISYATELHIYGGSGHKQYLGCFNCNPYSSDSICNEYGSHGSSYSSNSIWNTYGSYGSKFSSSSPWNAFASGNDVPVLVDKSGGFYGYFTINRFRANAFGSAADLYELFETVDGELSVVRKFLCKSM